MTNSLRTLPVILALVCGSLHPATGGVVINEIFYHAPNDIENLEYVELYNPTQEAVDLTGWRLTKGIRFTFPPNTSLSAGGYLVACQNVERFKEYFHTEALGGYQQSLSNSGERIDLEDSRGKKVDSVHYRSRAPWSTRADGYGSSLERICPAADSSLPENWAAAPLVGDQQVPSGTPGKKNSNYSENLPPIVAELRSTPANPAPGQDVRVEADVWDGDGLTSVTLRYRVAASAFESPETSVTMTNRAGKRFAATIPGQKANQLIRFRIEAVDSTGARRFFPGENEPCPAISSFVHERFELGKVPVGFVINVGTNEFAAAEKSLKSRSRGQGNEEEQKRFMVRQQIEAAVDLPGTWFQLVLEQNLGVDQFPTLRPVFIAYVSEGEKMADEIADSPALDERIKAMPEIVKTFNQGFLEKLRPKLSDAQASALAKWQDQRAIKAKEEGRRWSPERVLQHFIKLEKALFEVSNQSELTEAQWAKLKVLFTTLAKERAALVEPVQAVMKSEEQADRESIEKKFEAINALLMKGLKEALTPVQFSKYEQWQSQNNSFMPGRNTGPHSPANAKGESAFVYVDNQTGALEVFDFVHVSERSAGYKVRFHKDHPLRGMPGINLIYEYNDRFVLAEPLAYEVYRRSGVPAELTDFVRLSIDGKLLGYQLLIEQPNRTFLQRHKLKADGSLYKILWYGNGVVGQHEKKTSPSTGHDDLIALIDELEKTKGDAQWAVIERNFNVAEVVNYFAVNMCLSHWDGFFNNYFTYHDIGGKWEMYPWDQDKTWGYYDGIAENQIFFDMPLTFGMEGDVPPSWPKDKPPPKGFTGANSWWRPGGYFSKPLLANPRFRALFLARTRELLEKVYNEETFFPIIDSLRSRLQEEVRLRAEAIGQDPQKSVERLEKNLASFRDHLTQRRKFLLEQEELRTLRAAIP